MNQPVLWSDWNSRGDKLQNCKRNVAIVCLCLTVLSTGQYLCIKWSGDCSMSGWTGNRGVQYPAHNSNPAWGRSSSTSTPARTREFDLTALVAAHCPATLPGGIQFYCGMQESKSKHRTTTLNTVPPAQDPLPQH